MKTCFRINRPQVVHETFEDEAVIINLETGNYFSLDKSACDIWNLIEKGLTINEVSASLADLYQGSRQEMEDAVTMFIAELEREKLIVPLEAGAGTQGAGKHTHASLETGKSDFKAPVMQKYTDMQELLLLDPIHDVDAKGWPLVKPGSSGDT